MSLITFAAASSFCAADDAADEDEYNKVIGAYVDKRTASYYETLPKVSNPGPEGGSLVIGEIVSIHVDDRHLKEGRLDRNSLDLIGRMGGIQYTRTTERFEIVRPKIE